MTFGPASNLYMLEFSNIFLSILQQEDERFNRALTIRSFSGAQASVVNQVQPFNLDIVTGINTPLTYDNFEIDKRWVEPTAFQKAIPVDNFELEKYVADPKGEIMRNMVYAANRQKDAIVSAAFFGNAATGQYGGDVTPFPASNIIPVDYNSTSPTGMTVAKLLLAQEYLRANQVDLLTEEVTIGVTARQYRELMQETQVNSSEFSDTRVFESGQIVRFLGMNIVHYEYLPATIVGGETYRQIPVFAKSRMCLGIWMDIQARIFESFNLSSLPWTVYLRLMLGSTRIEEAGVMQVLCYEAPIT